jgi:hypothetical protein
MMVTFNCDWATPGDVSLSLVGGASARRRRSGMNAVLGRLWLPYIAVNDNASHA